MSAETHSDGDEIACPHCGAIERDLCDYSWGHSEVVETECGTCEKPYTLVRMVSVDYRATAIT